MDKNPTVVIELDRVRELRCSHKTMKRWSAYTGKSINALDTEALDPEGVEVLMFFMLEADAIKFQKNKLKGADGICGKLTWAAILTQ